MPFYVCEYCNYTTKKYTLITRHLKNKNPCRNEIIIMNNENISEIDKNVKTNKNE
jgi:hypothetical protein